MTIPPQKVIGYFIVNVQLKTQPIIFPFNFYVFHDNTCPQNLLSYAASERLGIIKFKIPNKASTSALDVITALNQPQRHLIQFILTH